MGADLGAVTWGRGGAWQAFLLFWRARAQKAEHVVWARPLPRRPRLSGCGCSDHCFGELWGGAVCVRYHPFHTLSQANVDLAFRIRWGGGGGFRELLRNGVSKFVSLLGVLGGPMFLGNLRLFDKNLFGSKKYKTMITKETAGKEHASSQEGRHWMDVLVMFSYSEKISL